MQTKVLLDNGLCNVHYEAIMDTNEEHNAQTDANEAIIKDQKRWSRQAEFGEQLDNGRDNQLESCHGWRLGS